MRIMAIVNFINASFNGKLGTLYGTKQFGNAYLKAIPFSHAPHTESQTKSVRAFEKLNRLACGLARNAFYVFGINDKKMLKHNAIAKLLKPIIKDKTFNIANLADLIPEDGTTEILEFTVDRVLNKITVRAQTNQPTDKSKKQYFVVCVFDENGKVLQATVPDINSYTAEIITLTEGKNFSVFAFRSDKKSNRQYLHGLSYSHSSPIV